MILLLLAAVSPARAQNVIINPDFDTDLAGWTRQNQGSATPNPSDGSPAPGSAQLSLTNGGSLIFTQCASLVGVPPPWTFTARLRQIKAADELEVYAGVLSAPCGLAATGSYLPATAGPSVPGVQGAFTQYSANLASDPMPGGQPSVAVYVTVRIALAPFSTATATYNLDNVYFGPPGNTPVELTGFGVE